MQDIKKLITICLVTIAIMAMAKTSLADSSALGDKPWGEFHFDGLGSTSACGLFSCVASDGDNSFFFLADSPWTFTGSGFLIVQDAFFRGDRFEVFDGIDSIGLTSIPVVDDPDLGPGCGSNPVNCFSDPGSSHRIFPLAAGNHSFTIDVVQAPFGAGAAYLCIDSGQGECDVPIGGDHEVPEPTSMILLGLGLAGALIWVKRPELSRVLVLITRKRERR